MIYLRLLRSVAGSDGTIFMKHACFWASVATGVATIIYRREGKLSRLRLLPDKYEIMIADPSFDGNPDFAGEAFREKNVKKGGE